ncbi:6-phosphogluconolactonase [Pontiella sulfatireligans]|uniref:6-phosphogluconolactonase n=1 Tax=Pontiella sulfatireligans TaxID=2750658 RepID=UPI0014442EAA|nr:6-phosphogluconolactonase [Pontiella sulfatireligans]
MHRFNSIETLTLQMLELLRQTLSTPGNLMLSGGSTPYAVYNRLAAAPCPVHPNRRLFLSDDRMEPADSPNNNAHNLDPMLKALACEDRFIRIDTSLPIEQAARQFEACLQPMETGDLGFLGMGADGHTAGLFTPEQARMDTGPLTLYTNRPDGMQGISATPAFFKRIEKIVLLVTGESKRSIINTLLSRPDSIPAGIALGKHPCVELWTDLESA